MCLVGGTAYGLAANDPRVPGIWTTVDGTSWTAATIPALGEGMSGTVAGFARFGYDHGRGGIDHDAERWCPLTYGHRRTN